MSVTAGRSHEGLQSLRRNKTTSIHFCTHSRALPRRALEQLRSPGCRELSAPPWARLVGNLGSAICSWSFCKDCSEQHQCWETTPELSPACERDRPHVSPRHRCGTCRDGSGAAAGAECPSQCQSRNSVYSEHILLQRKNPTPSNKPKKTKPSQTEIKLNMLF